MRKLFACALLAMAGPAVSEELFLDVLVNDKPIQAEATEFSENADVLSVSPEIWLSLGLVLSENEIGKPTLSSVELGLTLTIDRAKMIVSIKAPPSRIPVQQLGPKKREKSKVSPSASGVLINYDLAGVVGPKTPLSLSLGHEVRTGGNWGLLSTSGQLNATPDGLTYRRGFTTYTYDDPNRMLSYQAGDIVTRPSTTNPSVMMGGIRIASDPSLDPTQPSFSLPVLGGVALGTSTLDAYMNGKPVSHGEVGIGNFLTQDLPMITGANSVQLVLTDEFGRKITTTKNIYISTQQLRKGLSKWEVNAGLVRKGTSDTYGSPAVSASYARGMTDKLTVDGHVEATAEGHNMGVGVKAILGTAGSINVGVAKSTGPQGDGKKLVLEYEYTARNWGVNAGYSKQSDDWWDLSLMTHEHDPFSINNAQTSAHVGASFRFPEKNMSLRFNAARVEMDDTTRTRFDAQWTYDRKNNSYAVGVASINGEPQAFVSWRHTFEGKGAVSTQIRSKDDLLQTSIQAVGQYDRGNKNIVDWNARVGDNGKATFGDASVHWKNQDMEFNARGEVYDGDWRVSGGVRGSAWIGSGTKALLRPVEESFAIVRVPGIAGIPVFLENKLVGVTNSEGSLVVGPLQELEPSRITIDERKLPFDVQVEVSELFAVPNRKHAAMIVFPIRTMSARAFTVKWNGEFPKTGAQAKSGKEEVTIGHGGEIFLEHAEAGQEIQVSFKGASCKTVVPSPLPAFDVIAELECK